MASTRIGTKQDTSTGNILNIIDDTITVNITVSDSGRDLRSALTVTVTSPSVVDTANNTTLVATWDEPDNTGLQTSPATGWSAPAHDVPDDQCPRDDLAIRPRQPRTRSRHVHHNRAHRVQILHECGCGRINDEGDGHVVELGTASLPTKQDNNVARPIDSTSQL